jgi:NAD(P)-dependent dehydrogenase (short-subunit alcohol dehydrogenase family)
MSSIRFDGQVAIVTGAGGGLGRSHALMLAQRGAVVVVNDLGGTVSGVPTSDAQHTAAAKVVAEIEAAGGRALASTHNIATIEGAQAMVAMAHEAFGRIDVLINNAGILRDKTFSKMPLTDFEAVVDVHLMGSVYCTHAAMPIMQAQNYGRVVLTTSAAGLYGNFGQTNYGAAKLGLVGFMNSLKHEGAKFNIKVNTIAPVALTRMTEGIPLGRLMEGATPERVSAAAIYLASSSCEHSGEIISVGGGYFSRVQIMEGAGVFAPDDNITPEFVQSEWANLSTMDDARAFDSAGAALIAIFGNKG